MQSKAVAALLSAALIVSTPAASAPSLVDCDDLRRGATEAQARYIQTYTPRVDPVKTFDDATGACLEFISTFDVGFTFNIPSLGDLDAFLRNMAIKLLQRACQSATQQFNRAVNDAVQSVAGNTVLNNIPLVSGGITTGTSSSASGGIAVRDDGGSAARRAADSAVDRVINFVR